MIGPRATKIAAVVMSASVLALFAAGPVLAMSGCPQPATSPTVPPLSMDGGTPCARAGARWAQLCGSADYEAACENAKGSGIDGTFGGCIERAATCEEAKRCR